MSIDTKQMHSSEITLTRGDTLPIKILIIDENKDPYILQPDDSLFFTMKKSVSTKEIIIQKVVKGTEFIIEHDDTANLPYGKYVYDIQLTQGNGRVSTVIGPQSFELTGEVTYN